MKNWRCPNCAREHLTKDNIVSCPCPCCFSSMEEYPIKKRLDEKRKGFL